MEGSSEPKLKPNRKRRALLVLVVAAAVVSAGFVVYWEFIRPRTIAEVFAFSHFQPGTSVVVQGTITGIYRENTSYGPKVFLALDTESECNGTGQVFGDPNATYAVGQTFQTTLHFQSYTMNGDPAVSAPELACPFPDLPYGISTVLNTVSEVDGILLLYGGTTPDGWLRYNIVSQDGLLYNGSVLAVTLRKSPSIVGLGPTFPPGSAIDSIDRWTTLFSVEYIRVAGGFSGAPTVDRMASILSPSSENGTLRFVDADHDGQVGDGDHLDIRLPATGSPTAWDTYLLQVGELLGGTPTYVGAVHYLINGPYGPLETSASSMRTLVDLRYAGDSPGPPLRTSVQVTGVPLGLPPPISHVRYSLDMGTGISLSGNLSDLPATTPTGVTISITDANGNGMLDAGDRFTVAGVANHTTLTLNLESDGHFEGSALWIVGYGQPYRFYPDLSFTVAGTDPWTATANVPTWSPELALNRTLRASLFENGQEVLTNVSLASGIIGTFPNGTLSFTDADSDGYLSTGDVFTVRGNPTATYVLRISILFSQPIPDIYL